MIGTDSGRKTRYMIRIIEIYLWIKWNYSKYVWDGVNSRALGVREVRDSRHGGVVAQIAEPTALGG